MGKNRKRSKPQTEYTKFLESSQWKQIRKQVIERDGGKCVTCRSTQRLQVHHTLYRGGIGNEQLDDLVTLCSTCHERLHQKTSKHSTKSRSLSGVVKIYTPEEIKQYMQAA